MPGGAPFPKNGQLSMVLLNQLVYVVKMIEKFVGLEQKRSLFEIVFLFPCGGLTNYGTTRDRNFNVRLDLL